MVKFVVGPATLSLGRELTAHVGNVRQTVVVLGVLRYGKQGVREFMSK